MKHIIFCTYPSLYSSIVLQQLLNSPQIHIDAIIASSVISKRSRFPSISIIKHSGIRYASYLWIVTSLFHVLPFKQLHSTARMAKTHHIPYFKTNDINGKETQGFLKQYPTSYLFTSHFNQIINISLSSFSKRPCINMHPSLLPKNKGVDPVFYALLRHEHQQGVSIHKISHALDGGDLYCQQQLENSSANSLFTINRQLFKMGSKLFIHMLTDTENTSTAQDKEGNYDSWPQRKDCQKVKSLLRLNDFFSTIY